MSKPGVIRSGALRYFGMVFGAGFVLGAIRVTLVVPRLGERWAELLEMPLMLAVIVFAARFVQRRARRPLDTDAALALGLLALLLLVGAEIGVVLLQGRSIADYVAARDPVSGAVYAALLVVYALMPWWLARRARRSRRVVLRR